MFILRSLQVGESSSTGFLSQVEFYETKKN